jgi:hypothetical protein
MLTECVDVSWSWHLPSRMGGTIAHCASAALPQSNTASMSKCQHCRPRKAYRRAFVAAHEPCGDNAIT